MKNKPSMLMNKNCTNVMRLPLLGDSLKTNTASRDYTSIGMIIDD